MTRVFIRDAVARAKDIALMGELPAHAPLVDAVEHRNADVVIFGTPAKGLPDDCFELMSKRPQTRVLTVERNGHDAFLYELRPFARPLGQVSSSELLEAIRDAVATR